MKILLNDLKNSLNKHYDVFLASASYEDRSLSIMKAIENEIKIDKKFVSLSIPHKALIQKNLELFRSDNFEIIEIDNTDQIKSAINLMVPLSNVLEDNPKASFILDISTFTRQTLLILFRLLRNNLTRKNQIKFLYTPAEDYSIGLPYEAKWLTKGISQVNSIFGYSGVIRPSRPYHLIILMGFEVERASSLISAYEPSKITVGYASENDSVSNSHYQLNIQKFDELLSEFPYAESFEFSCIDVLKSKSDILEQTKKHIDYNVIVSPMNNKISTVSAALAAFENNEIQLAIAIPAIYNYDNYSIPSDYCYILEMPDFIKDN